MYHDSLRALKASIRDMELRARMELIHVTALLYVNEGISGGVSTLSF